MMFDPSSIWLLEVSEIFAHWLYLPLVVLLPTMLLTRRWWATALLCFPLVAFVVGYGPLWLPKSPVVVAATDASTLRVMSWNTWRSPAAGDSLIEAVQTIQPDVIALQEVSGTIAPSVRELAQTYPYQLYSMAGGRGSLMILSRWPITDEITDIDWLGCYCLRATIDWQGQPVHVVNVHVWSPVYEVAGWDFLPIVTDFHSAHQAHVIDALLADLDEVELPLIVMGDFNTTDGQSNYDRVIASGLVDGQRQAGWGLGLTYPAPFTAIDWLPFSLIRIDYVFSSPAWTTIHFETVRVSASDHRSVVADLALR